MPLYRWQLEITDAQGRRTTESADAAQSNPQEFEGTAADFADRRLRDWIAVRQGSPEPLPAAVDVLVWPAERDGGDPEATTHWESSPSS